MKIMFKKAFAIFLVVALLASSTVVGFAADVSITSIPCLDQLVPVPGGYCYVYPPDYNQSGGTVTLNDAYSYYRAAIGDPSKVVLYVFDSSGNLLYPAQIQAYVFDASSFAASSAVYSGKTYLSLKSSESQLIAFSLPSPENPGWNVGVQTGRQSVFTAPLTTCGVYVAQGSVTLPAWVKVIKDISRFEVLSESDFGAGASHTLTVNYLYTENTLAADSFTQSLASGAEYSIPSPEIEGYTPDTPLVSGTMPDEDLTINVFYSRAFYPLTIKYQYADGRKASEDISFQYPLGFVYDVPSPEIEGYQPDKPTIAGEMPGEALEAVVTYTAIPYTLTVNYQYVGGGQAAPSYQEQLIIGSNYYVTSPVIEGYHPNQLAVSGVMPASDVVSTVTYREDSGGSSGPDPVGPGEGGDSGSGDSGEGGSGSGYDPFIPSLPPFSGKDPFVIPDMPEYSGYDPFKIVGPPAYSGYDPFIVPRIPAFSGYDPFAMPNKGDIE